MSLENIKSKTQAQKGFTIVELLIVVVVIAILAAITIVSYNGITNRANASAAASSAATVQKKAELYASDGPTGLYPANASAAVLTSAAPSTTYYLSGVTVQGTAPDASNGKTTVQYFVCGHSGTTTAPANIAAITAVTGGQVAYFDFAAGTGVKTISMGNTSTAVGTFPVACRAS